ncbi:MAG: hypothetical protein D6744_03565 [Planctomycetota bacterium]|nr:MAG: hypothetical protein D6744_03565 [Planctomycetota bacterium]
MRMILVSIAAALTTALPVRAGLFEDLYRGATLFATPSGGPLSGTVGGGLANGQRLGRVRIVPNRFGKGWRFELDRSFGADSFGRPEVFDLGNYELELSGSLNATGEITTRGIPTFESDFATNQLNYSLRAKSGAQDVDLSGTLNIQHVGEFNPLGFYDVQITVSNTNSELSFDGVAVDGGIDTDFDVGPISLRGNVFVDLIAAGLASLGVDVSIVSEIFPASPIDRIVEDIQASLAQQAKVLSQRFAADPIESGDPAAGLAPVAPDDAALDSSALVGPVAGGVSYTTTPTPIPEPHAGWIVIAAGAWMTARKRRR